MRVGDHGYHRDFPNRRGVIIWLDERKAQLKYFDGVDAIIVSRGFIVIDVPIKEKAK